MRAPCSIAALAMLALSAPVAAQNPPEAPPRDPPKADPGDEAPPPSLGRKLGKEQVAAWLDQVKTGLLPKVWPDKCASDDGYRRKYLDKWQAVVSDHYIVFTNGPTATCKKYAVTLEDLYAAIQRKLPFADLDHLMTAYIFADREDYYRYCVAISGYTPEGARQTAGHANSQFYATYYASPRDGVVFHEATHEIVGACMHTNGVGSWFQEGMAVYFQKVLTNDNPRGAAKNDIRHGDWYPLREFCAIPVLLSDPKGNGHRNYDHAGALLEFMIDTKLEPVAGKFMAFLAAARQGRGFGRGLEISEKLVRDVYGLSLEQFEALWLQHLGVAR